MANLTEDQSTALLAKIDDLNATYDWANMSEEEILVAMEVIKVELQELHDEFGITPPQNPSRQGKRHHGSYYQDDNEPEDTVEDIDEA